MIKHMKTSLMILVVFTVILGGLYPIVVTGVGQLVFNNKANGSLIKKEDGTVIGSELIGQNFTSSKYFWGRLSATAEQPYNAAASGASNYSFTHPKLIEASKERVAALTKSKASPNSEIPVDLITASGSGLDPDITLDAALYQVPRVAKARGKSEDEVKKLVESNKQSKFLWVFGQERVNVLKLNLALDASQEKKTK